MPNIHTCPLIKKQHVSLKIHVFLYECRELQKLYQKYDTIIIFLSFSLSRDRFVLKKKKKKKASA